MILLMSIHISNINIESGTFSLMAITLVLLVLIRKTIENYIKNKELEDQIADSRSLKEYKDPFTGK